MNGLFFTQKVFFNAIFIGKKVDRAKKSTFYSRTFRGFYFGEFFSILVKIFDGNWWIYARNAV